MTFTGNVSSFIRPKRNARMVKRSLEKRISRRTIKAGYPAEPYIMTFEQVQNYLSGDRITCLLCGHTFKGLGVHVPSIHGMTTKDYRKRYGLPLRTGLSSLKTKELKRKNMLNGEWINTFREFHKDPKITKKRNSSTREKSSYAFTRAIHNIKKATLATRLESNGSFYPDTTWDRFLEFMREGKTPQEIFKIPNMPKNSCYNMFKKLNPSFAEAISIILQNASFPYLAKMEMLDCSLRFEQEVRNLRGLKLSDHKISEKMGVTAMTINRFRNRKCIL